MLSEAKKLRDKISQLEDEAKAKISTPPKPILATPEPPCKRARLASSSSSSSPKCHDNETGYSSANLPLCSLQKNIFYADTSDWTSDEERMLDDCDPDYLDGCYYNRPCPRRAWQLDRLIHEQRFLVF